MNQLAFTAQELAYMATLAQKRNMYGIPNIPSRDIGSQLRQAGDSLLEKQVIQMDMDGKVRLLSDYAYIVDFLCDCTQCVAVYLQQKQRQCHNIFWKQDDRYLMAEIRDGRYMFSAVDGTTVDTMLHSLPLAHTPGARIVETVLPQMALRKAHRLCCEQLHDDAVRLLRQHGADLMVAEAVVDSFSNQGESIHILYLLRTTGAPKTIERTYLWSRGLCFWAEQTVQGLRTCTRFTASETADVRQTIQNISMAFLENT